MTPSPVHSEMTQGFGRRCPVCNKLEREVLLDHRFSEGPLGDGYEVVVCGDCGCGYADGIPSQADMDRYYAERSKYTYAHLGGLESKWDFARFETTVEHLKPHIGSKESRILDIGCATGGLLSVFQRAGFSNLLGADPSPVCSLTGMKVHGVTIKTANLAELGGWTERFDLITMLGVLEHVREAGDAVRIAKSLLRAGGNLYCAVPDVEGLVECPNAPYQQFSFEHVNFFSTQSLSNLLAVNGMETVKNWSWTTEWRESVREPIASGLFTSCPMRKPVHDWTTLPALKKYIEHSKAGDLRITSLIDSLTKSQKPILIWGAGTLARRLLATTSLSAANIRAFIDSDPQLQGTTLAGRVILPPKELRTLGETILICSSPFRSEILSAIEALHITNPVMSIDPQG
jgi:2-polyprenyl-3-methyl-5-hydroxy-6-metoxy-1,4-benzoquinol methylase